MCWATRLQPLVGGKFLCLCYSQALSEEEGARNGPENDSLTYLPSSFNLYAVCGRGSCFASSSFPTVYCCYLLPAVCTRLPEQPLRPKRKKTPACAAKIPMVTEAEGAARDSLYPLQVRQVPCFPGLPLLVRKPVSVSAPRKQQGESHDRVSTARGTQCGLYQGVSWLLLARLLGTCLRARVQSSGFSRSESFRGHWFRSQVRQFTSTCQRQL